MGNASDEVKAAASHVTPHVDEDGIARACRDLGLIWEGVERLLLLAATCDHNGITRPECTG